MHLRPEHFGKLIDFFGSQQDLKDRVIRVLHSLSFVDDPTRIIRAIRFEQRFQFSINSQTERLIKNAVRLNLFDKLSGARIRHELRLLTEDAAPVASLMRMREFNLLQEIHPLLHFQPSREHCLEEIEKTITWYKLLFREPAPDIWIVYFLGLVSGLDVHQVRSVMERLQFPHRTQELVEGIRKQLRFVTMMLAHWGKNSGTAAELYEILIPLPLEGVLYSMAQQRKPDLKKAISHFLTKLQDVVIAVSGKDVRNMGVEPGPIYAAVLSQVHRAVLNGQASTRQEQLDVLWEAVQDARTGHEADE